MDNDHHNYNKFSRIIIKLINLLNYLRIMVIKTLKFFLQITMKSIYLFLKKWQNKYYGPIHRYNKLPHIFVCWDAKLISLWNTFKTLFVF